MSNTEQDVVVIGIGHSTLGWNANSDRITNPQILELAKKDGGFDAKKQIITEYWYCASFAAMVVEELALLNIKGITSNRYKGADLNGNSKVLTAMMPEVKAINNANTTGEYAGRIKAAVNLHLNAYSSASANGYENLAQATPAAKSLSKLLYDNIIAVTGFKKRPEKLIYEHTRMAGSTFCRNVKVPAVLVELFFVTNDSDLLKGLSLKRAMAKAMATAFKQFIDKDYPAFDPEQALKDSKVKSVALVQDKLKPRFTDDDIKTSALQTQDVLTPIERKFGEGGDKYSINLRNSIEVVGTKPPPFSSSLVDYSGNVSESLRVRPGGVAVEQSTYPLFQTIDYTSDMPTGKKSLFVNSLYEVTAYENNINSSGHTRLTAGGNISIKSGQQIDMLSSFNLNLEASSIIRLVSSNIQIEGPTSIKGNINANGSIVATGAIYADGGVSAPSINGPAIIDKTNQQELYGYLSSNNINFKLGPCEIQLNKPIAAGDTSISIAAGDLSITGVDSGQGENNSAIITVPSHCHYFKRLNGILADSSLDIQTSISDITNKL